MVHRPNLAHCPFVFLIKIEFTILKCTILRFLVYSQGPATIASNSRSFITKKNSIPFSHSSFSMPPSQSWAIIH